VAEHCFLEIAQITQCSGTILGIYLLPRNAALGFEQSLCPRFTKPRCLQGNSDLEVLDREHDHLWNKEDHWVPEESDYGPASTSFGCI
jgi:hypothetical protein